MKTEFFFGLFKPKLNQNFQFRNEKRLKIQVIFKPKPNPAKNK